MHWLNLIDLIKDIKSLAIYIILHSWWFKNNIHLYLGENVFCSAFGFFFIPSHFINVPFHI